jgi:hypothetical protein
MYGCCNFDTDKLYNLIITGSEPQAWGAAAAAHMLKKKTLVAGPGLSSSDVLEKAESGGRIPQTDVREKLQWLGRQAVDDTSTADKLAVWYRNPCWELFGESDWVSVLTGVPEIASLYTIRIHHEYYHGLNLLITGRESPGDLVPPAFVPLEGLDIMGIPTDSRGNIRVNDRFETGITDFYAAGSAIGKPVSPKKGIMQGITIAQRIVTNHQQN